MQNFCRITFLILIMFYASSNIAQNKTLYPEVLHDFYDSVIQKYRVPGMAVAIVLKDSIILQEGFGYQDINQHEKVNAHTIFGIASLSKTFTAGLMARAVDQGKLTFGKPISTILPAFRLYDSYVTSKVTVRDALAHRTGLDNFSGDLIWYGSNVNDSVIMSRLRHLKPEYGFRSHFGYSNIMYLVAGKMLEQIYHKPVYQLFDSVYFDPLQMKNTTALYQKAMAHQNIAQPHIEKNDSIIQQTYISWNNMMAAGGVFATASDMTRYIKMWLNDGVFNNQQVVPETQIEKLWSQLVPTELSWLDTKLDAPVNFKNYGMGWAMMNYKGHKVVHHSGGLDGMVCHLVLIPAQKTGAVFMTNKTTPLPTILVYDLLDRIYNNGKKNYAENALDVLNNLKQGEDETEPVFSTETDFNSDFYTGTYYDSLVGVAKVQYADDTLRIKWKESNVFSGYLLQTDMLSFRLRWPKMPSLPEGAVHFIVDGLGQVSGFTIRLANPDLHFDELKFMKIRNE